MTICSVWLCLLCRACINQHLMNNKDCFFCKATITGRLAREFTCRTTADQAQLRRRVSASDRSC
ncbi:E3 ubiquitin-protein ligase RNF123 [Liparis tanakae]|uniref:E3 ubiquitin-protein ligase RNF123 n=1 Tax=Liparis tanakae TaxID=230148 RepID=A0A4Z2FJ18_9TELE|nr:E3 ubiquitin-protein ligase RNF123 [Liparis tanakae]